MPGVEQYISERQFNDLFPHRNQDGESRTKLYEYRHFIEATESFPSFANAGTDEVRRREVAAFLANIAQETTGGWDGAPGGRYRWGLYHLEECDKPGNYCDSGSTEYPCQPGRSYHGRGPLQLSWNYNYGRASYYIFGGDKMKLLRHPDRVAQDGTLAFKTALWFWMTPQAPKPSCHDAITGIWKPSREDENCGRKVGFGATINIINGGIECGRSPMDKTKHRVKGFKFFCEKLGTTYGHNLTCECQQSY